MKIIGEVRTKDAKKLLFQIGKEKEDFFLLIKPRGIERTYSIPLQTIMNYIQYGKNEHDGKRSIDL